MNDELLKRCPWCGDSEIYVAYHDEEWGVPLHDDRRLFEMLVLEGAQAGLSWLTILKKRQGYREAFDNFDAARIARYDGRKVARLMENSDIVRHELKIMATIGNAQAFLAVKKDFGSFDRYIWQFTGGKPIQYNRRAMSEVKSPAADPASTGKKRMTNGDGPAPTSAASDVPAQIKPAIAGG